MSARRNLLARVHMAKAALALHEDSYRAILTRIAGQDSAADIDNTGLARVLEEFRRLGWQPANKRPLSKKAHVRKVWAVWGDMKHLVAKPGPAALRAFVQRQTGVTDPEWLDGKQANTVIEGLKAWRARLLRDPNAAPPEAADADPR